MKLKEGHSRMDLMKASLRGRHVRKADCIVKSEPSSEHLEYALCHRVGHVPSL